MTSHFLLLLRVKSTAQFLRVEVQRVKRKWEETTANLGTKSQFFLELYLIPAVNQCSILWNCLAQKHSLKKINQKPPLTHPLQQHTKHPIKQKQKPKKPSKTKQSTPNPTKLLFSHCFRSHHLTRLVYLTSVTSDFKQLFQYCSVGKRPKKLSRKI